MYYYPYLYPYIPRTWTWYMPPPPVDPVYFMNAMMQAILYPYYYSLVLEAYKAMIETWRKTFELILKQMETSTTKS